VAGCCECGNESFVFHKMRGISKELLASEEDLCSME
jgi:hypothetical protein